jgi:hypothetical protein
MHLKFLQPFSLEKDERFSKKDERFPAQLSKTGLENFKRIV